MEKVVKIKKTMHKIYTVYLSSDLYICTGFKKLNPTAHSLVIGQMATSSNAVTSHPQSWKILQRHCHLNKGNRQPIGTQHFSILFNTLAVHHGAIISMFSCSALQGFHTLATLS